MLNRLSIPSGCTRITLCWSVNSQKDCTDALRSLSSHAHQSVVGKSWIGRIRILRYVKQPTPLLVIELEALPRIDRPHKGGLQRD